MNFEIIPIQDQDGVRTVNARELHEFLNVGKMFAHWIKDRIEQYGFEEGKDFTIDLPVSANQKGRGGDRRSKEYHLSMDMAKELSMVERTHHGKLARQYFIACEKQLLDQQLDALRRPAESSSKYVEEVTLARTLARMSNPMERAETIGQFIDNGKTVQELTEELGCRSSNVYLLLSLRRLSQTAQDAVRSREITLRAAGKLASISDESKQLKVLKTIQTKKLTERESLAMIRGSM